MSNQEKSPEFAPHDAIDLRDQNNVFLALEELGIAHMQHVWVRENDPQHKDAAVVAEQAEEFLADMTGLLLKGDDPARLVQNGWAGAAVATHLRKAIASELRRKLEKTGREDAVETLSDEDTVRLSLLCYLDDVERLTARDTMEKMMGRKVPPQEYIDFMIGWSGVFCGRKDTLELPTAFMLFKGSHL